MAVLVRRPRRPVPVTRITSQQVIRISELLTRPAHRCHGLVTYMYVAQDRTTKTMVMMMMVMMVMMMVMIMMMMMMVVVVVMVFV